MTLRCCGRFHDPAMKAGRWWCSGGERAADGDAGGCLAGGDAASGGGERLPGFGFVVAVPVTADCYPASAQFVQDGVAPVAADRSGEAGGGGAVAGGGDCGAARGGERDLARMEGCPARWPFLAGTAWRAAARITARTSSQAVIHAACSARIIPGMPERKIGPFDGPAPRMADLSSRSAVRPSATCTPAASTAAGWADQSSRPVARQNVSGTSWPSTSTSYSMIRIRIVSPLPLTSASQEPSGKNPLTCRSVMVLRQPDQDVGEPDGTTTTHSSKPPASHDHRRKKGAAM